MVTLYCLPKMWGEVLDSLNTQTSATQYLWKHIHKVITFPKVEVIIFILRRKYVIALATMMGDKAVTAAIQHRADKYCSNIVKKTSKKSYWLHVRMVSMESN